MALCQKPLGSRHGAIANDRDGVPLIVGERGRAAKRDDAVIARHRLVNRFGLFFVGIDIVDAAVDAHATG